MACRRAIRPAGSTRSAMVDSTIVSPAPDAAVSSERPMYIACP